MVEKRAERRARWASVREGSSGLEGSVFPLLLFLLFSVEALSVVLSAGLALSPVEAVDSEDSVVLEVSVSEAADDSVSDLVASVVSPLVDSCDGGASVWGGGGI